MVKILEWPTENERFTVPHFSSAEGKVVANDLAVPAATDEKPKCIVVEEISSENQQANLLGLGNGALLDMDGFVTAAAPGTIIFSDGDGTISSTKPAGTAAAGEIVWKIGEIEENEDGDATTTILRVDIQPIRSES